MQNYLLGIDELNVLQPNTDSDSGSGASGSGGKYTGPSASEMFETIIGIVICGIYVIATCSLSGIQNIAMAVFTAVVQGVLVAGLSTYVNQIFKQLNKEE